MTNIKQLRERWAFMLADKALLNMSNKDIVARCPVDYGTEVTDDHRSYIWDMLADMYLECEDDELFEMYDRFIQKGKPMGVLAKDVMEEIADEMAEIIMESLEGDEQIDAMIDSLEKDRIKKH